MEPMDLTAYGVIALKDVDAAVRDGASEILTRAKVVLTPSAREAVQRHGIVVRAADTSAPPQRARCRQPRTSDGVAAGARQPPRPPAGQAPRPPVSQAVRDLFNSPEADAIKAEIVATGKKLWRRQYVDGNGGNISYRLGPNEVICTPTLLSKADLRPEDLSLVDLDGNELIRGTRRPDERDLPPPRDLQGPAESQGRRPLPSAARDGLRLDRPRAAFGA